MTQPHATTTRGRRWASPFVAVVLLGSRVAAHSFPYVPTQILMPRACLDDLPCDGRDVAYIFRQNDDGVEFLSLNYSTDVTEDTRLWAVTQDLPFLDTDGGSIAFGAARTADGSVLVYAGACDGGRGDLWNYGGDDDDWTQRTVENLQSDEEGRGPYFLGGTVAFSSTLAPSMDRPTLYTYGGMCATPDTDPSSWQSAGDYTKTMMSLAPSHKESDTDYSLGVASTSGPRTPIAGFTLTPLTPSTTNLSGTVTQQASFVLLGGHTDTAFINMSTAAVWNLPEESWTYVNIQPPGARGTTELAIKEVSTRQLDDIDSRSGHTAVLSEDGSSLVVYGGWVGDVDTPAEPQLAVLEMSQAYSGWQWSIPDEQPEGDGLYGHGAAVLPGNVMVLYGGWPIGSSISKAKRQEAIDSPRFLNLTSMSWTSSYTNPASTTSDTRPGSPSQDGPRESEAPNDPEESEHAESDSSSGNNRTTLALGLGLGIGLAVLLSTLTALCCWYMQKKKKRESRDKAVRALSQDASNFMHDSDEMVERSEFLPWSSQHWYAGGQDPYQQGSHSLGFESLRASRGNGYGSSGPPPPITMSGGLRRPAPQKGNRGGYMPAASHPGGFASATGHIHPILEDDEEEHHQFAVPDQHRHSLHDPGTPTSEVPSDPFLTPVATNAPPMILLPPGRSSGTPSPENMRRHDPEVEDWVSDVGAADAMLARMNARPGRGSPTRRNSHRSTSQRDDESRSGSNLSESNRSAVESLRRSPSARKVHPAGSGSLLGGSTLLGSSEQAKPGSSSSSSYNTARSSFGALQAEGPSLLLGGTSPTYDEHDTPGSPSKSKPRRGWLGSLRRVFSTSGTTSPASSARDESPRRRSMEYDQGGGDYEAPLVGLSGELLRRKQGRHDWESTVPATTRERNQESETDWDIERAVEQRLVQVVFTVPKERLRVVNADDNDGGTDESQIAELVDPAPSTPIREEPLTPLRQEMQEKRHTFMSDMSEKHPGSALERLDSSDYRMSIDSGPVLMTAEAVTVKTLSRPKSRVLQMVDTIESKSREGSPTRPE